MVGVTALDTAGTVDCVVPTVVTDDVVVVAAVIVAITADVCDTMGKIFIELLLIDVIDVGVVADE